MEDFHPDRLYRHEAFATLRLLRSELAVPGGTARVAAALELPLPAAPNRGGESDDEAIARLLGRAPDGTPAAGAAQDIVARLAREITAVQASAAPDAAAPGLAKALDARFAARMSESFITRISGLWRRPGAAWKSSPPDIRIVQYREKQGATHLDSRSQLGA